MTKRNRAGARWLLALVWLLLAEPGLAPALAAGAGAAPAAAAAVYNVNSTNDAVADFTGDPSFTLCQTAPANTTCTLRAAVMNANRHGGSAIINLPGGTYRLTIPRVAPFGDINGSLDISHTLTVQGAGAAGTIVDATGIDRAFFVATSAVLTLTGVTLAHGFFASGGGGGAIANEGQLSLLNSVVRDSQAGNAAGGGLDNVASGTAIVRNTTIESNTAATNGGGINNFGTLTIEASTIDNNTAANGGGVENNAGSLTVFDSTLSNNGAIGYGGGVDNSGTATASFYQTTIAGNLADSNAHTHATGGGIHNNAGAAHMQLFNTLLAGNFISHTLNDCTSAVTSQDYTLFQTTAGCSITGLTADNVMTLSDPLLGELADNGGGTRTRALLPGSPALDRIPATFNGPCQNQFGTAPVPDQRGITRPVNGLCDVGAYEGAQALSPYFQNLVRNGDAEASAGSPSAAWVGAAEWFNKSGQFTVVPTDTLPANHGLNFFAGGAVTDTIGAQVVPLPVALSPSVNAGIVNFVFSADLGGLASENDNAQVELRFDNAAHGTLGLPIFIGPVSAADRGNLTTLIHQAASGVVPANTAEIVLDVILTRVSTVDTYNDGYADNISLVLLPKHALFLPLLRR